MLDSIIALLGIEFNTSTEKVDIAKGQYKLPETNKEMIKTIKKMKKEGEGVR